MMIEIMKKTKEHFPPKQQKQQAQAKAQQQAQQIQQLSLHSPEILHRHKSI